ncbi:MAG: PLD nuclease N-terminal domain-containing protein, partial [Actinomycetota bacterium]
GWILTIWALVDAIRVPHDSMFRAGTKLIWVLVILFGNLVGSIVYMAVGRPVAGSQPPPLETLPSNPPAPAG